MSNSGMEKWRAVVYLGGNSDLETIEFCDKKKNLGSVSKEIDRW